MRSPSAKSRQRLFSDAHPRASTWLRAPAWRHCMSQDAPLAFSPGVPSWIVGAVTAYGNRSQQGKMSLRFAHTHH